MTRGLRAAAAVLAAFFAVAPAGSATTDEFFIISSLDLARGTIVVKRPTEVTLVLRVDGRTRCRAENGRAMRLSDLRAGDTVFIVSERGSDGQPVARTVREGIMTLPELRRRYLRADR